MRQKGFAPIVLVLTLALVAAVAYIAYLKGYLNLNPEQKPFPLATADLTVSSPTPNRESPPEDPTTAWKTYSIERLGLVFKLPEELSGLGDLLYSTSASETGSELCWTFPKSQSMLIKKVYAGGGPCAAEHFGIAATTIDHSAGRSGGFADAKYFKLPGDIDKTHTKQFTNSYGVNIIRIIGNTATPAPDDAWQGLIEYFGDLGQNSVGALVQYTADGYETITVRMDLTKTLTVETFDQILSTFKFTK